MTSKNQSQYRDRYFWVGDGLFPDWPYKDRRAIATRLDNAWFKNELVYRFWVMQNLYEIEPRKAQMLADKYHLVDKKGKKWDILPLQEFRHVSMIAVAQKVEKNTLF